MYDLDLVRRDGVWRHLEEDQGPVQLIAQLDAVSRQPEVVESLVHLVLVPHYLAVVRTWNWWRRERFPCLGNFPTVPRDTDICIAQCEEN